jgi:hypothetical protein
MKISSQVLPGLLPVRRAKGKLPEVFQDLGAAVSSAVLLERLVLGLDTPQSGAGWAAVAVVH